MVNWQLSKKAIHWPVSLDCSAGSSVQLIEATCFLHYQLTSYWFLMTEAQVQNFSLSKKLCLVVSIASPASWFWFSEHDFKWPVMRGYWKLFQVFFIVFILRIGLTLLGLCMWKSCEKGVKSVWKKGTMWNQCWKKYKFTTWAFHMHVNFLICVWNFVIHVKNFCHMCELFFHAFYYMWNLFIHVKQFCHACELQISHA